MDGWLFSNTVHENCSNSVHHTEILLLFSVCCQVVCVPSCPRECLVMPWGVVVHVLGTFGLWSFVFIQNFMVYIKLYGICNMNIWIMNWYLLHKHEILALFTCHCRSNISRIIVGPGHQQALGTGGYRGSDGHWPQPLLGNGHYRAAGTRHSYWASVGITRHQWTASTTGHQWALGISTEHQAFLPGTTEYHLALGTTGHWAAPDSSRHY